MSKCGSCVKDILVASECAVCALCDTSYHYECSLREARWRNMSVEQRSKWQCNKCKGSASQQLSRANSGSSGLVDSDVGSINANDDASVKQMLRTIMEEMGVLKEVRAKVEAMETSLNFHTKQYDDLLREVKQLRQENSALAKEVAILKKENDGKDGHLNDLTARLNALEQYGRSINMEVCGLEQLSGENVGELLQNIGAKLDVPYVSSDIQAAHRIPSGQRGQPKPLLVQFVNKKTKSIWMEAAKKKPMVSRNVVGTSDAKLFFRDNLTPYYKRLLRETKDVARNYGFKFVWVKNGRILVKFDESEGGRVYNIVSYADLNQLK